MLLLLIFVLILLVVVAILLAVINWYRQYFKYERYLSKFGGPKPYPIVGNGLDFLSTSVILPRFTKYAKEFGTFRIYLAHEPNLVVSNPKLIEKLLSSTQLRAKTATYNFLKGWLGNGLLTTNSDVRWKTHRKIITPSFHFRLLEIYVDTFNTVGSELINVLAQNAKENRAFDISECIVLYALDVISEAVMGIPINALKSHSDYADASKDLTKICVDRTFNPSERYDWLYRFSKNFSKEKKAIKIAHAHTNGVIRQRKEAFLSQPKMGNNSNVKQKCLLDILLAESIYNQSLSDEQMREEVETIMFAGHDTTAWTLNFVIYCLSNNRDIQQRVYEEVKTILGDSDQVTYQNLHDMKYMELVIKETMRCYATIPLFARLVTEDLEFEKKIIPKGTTIIFHPFWMHQDPGLYPEPEKFIPERFLSEERKENNPFQYIPFSAGHRNCIGQKFAMLEMKSTIAKIVLNFNILPTNPKHELKLVSEAVLKAENGVTVMLKHRHCN